MNKIQENRYDKFLLEEYERPVLPKTGKVGLIRLPNKPISEAEQCENRNQIEKIECIFHTVCELFEIDDVELQCTGFSNSFFLIKNHETCFNNQHGFLSVELSRDKLKNATAKELSGAIIDILRNRKNWNKEMYYSTLHL